MVKKRAKPKKPGQGYIGQPVGPGQALETPKVDPGGIGPKVGPGGIQPRPGQRVPGRMEEIPSKFKLGKKLKPKPKARQPVRAKTAVPAKGRASRGRPPRARAKTTVPRQRRTTRAGARSRTRGKR